MCDGMVGVGVGVLVRWGWWVFVGVVRGWGCGGVSMGVAFQYLITNVSS